MKKYLLILPCLLILGLSACSDKYYVTERIFEDNGGNWAAAEAQAIKYDVPANGWGWNPYMNRYEFVFDEELIGDDLFYDGMVIGSVYFEDTFVDKNGNPITAFVQKPLAYHQTYKKPTGETYTLTISCDISPIDGNEPGKLAFYIQTSDIVSAVDHLQNYEFKVTYLWGITGESDARNLLLKK